MTVLARVTTAKCVELADFTFYQNTVPQDTRMVIFQVVMTGHAGRCLGIEIEQIN